MRCARAVTFWRVSCWVAGIATAAAVVIAGCESRPAPSPSRSSPPSSAGLGAHAPAVNIAAFAGHGDLAFISRATVWVLDGMTGSLRRIVTPGMTPLGPAFSPDGRWLAFSARSANPSVQTTNGVAGAWRWQRRPRDRVRWRADRLGPGLRCAGSGERGCDPSVRALRPGLDADPLCRDLGGCVVAGWPVSRRCHPGLAVGYHAGRLPGRGRQASRLAPAECSPWRAERHERGDHRPGWLVAAVGHRVFGCSAMAWCITMTRPRSM